MDVFRDLYLRGKPEQLAATLNAIERSLTDGWTRYQETRPSGTSLQTKPVYGYCCERDGARPAAVLYLTEKTPELLSVSNIVPRDQRQLEYSAYNRILEEFCTRFVKPSARETGVVVELTAAQFELTQWLSPETADKLQRFSALANKSTGSAHPADHERWMDFLIAAHREGSKLEGAALRRWLIEMADWPAEVAVQLASEYEIGRDVLAYSELRRGA